MSTPLEAIEANDAEQLKSALASGGKLPAKAALIEAVARLTRQGLSSAGVLAVLLDAKAGLTVDDLLPLVGHHSAAEEGALTIEQVVALLPKLTSPVPEAKTFSSLIDAGQFWPPEWTLLFRYLRERGESVPPGIIVKLATGGGRSDDWEFNDALLLSAPNAPELTKVADGFAVGRRPLSLAGLNRAVEAKVEASRFPALVVRQAGAERTPPRAIYALTHLEELWLIGFAEVDADLAKLKALKKLTLENIGTLPKALASLPSLVELEVSLASLAEVFANPPLGIRILDVMGGDLPQFPPGISNLPNLEELRVGFGRAGLQVTGFSTLPAEVGDLPKLRDLRFGCELETLPKEIAKLPLEALFFESKKIKLPPEFGEIKTLQKWCRSAVLKRVARGVPLAGGAGGAAGAAGSANVFAGQRWCVTGTLENYRPRSKAEALIESRGGLISKGVDKTVTHLLVGSDAGDEKLGKAKKLGVKAVDEKAFELLLNQAAPEAGPAVKKSPAKDSKLKEAIVAAIRNQKWEGGVEPILTGLQPAISISTAEGKAKVGASKLGGRPDLPKVMKWPVIPDEEGEGSVPLTFIAQLNIQELKHLDFEGRLPAEGMIYLFMYLLRDGIQDDYASGGEDGWLKIHCSSGVATNDLKPATPPKKLREAEAEDLVGVLEEHPLSFSEDYTLPSAASLTPALSAKDAQAFATLVDETIPALTHGRTESQLLGHPQTVQGGASRDDGFFLQLSESLGSFDRVVRDGAVYFSAPAEDVVRGDFNRASVASEFT